MGPGMSTDFNFIAEEIRSLRSASEDLRRRLASVVMIGQVSEISGDKQRLTFDDKDASTGEPFKSPLVRRASASGSAGGGHKERNRPAMGETMALISPNGEIGRHSRAIPYGPTDDSAEPAGDEGFARVFSEGDASVAIKAGEIRLKVGGVTFKINGAGIEITGGTIKHDGKSIDKDHVHGGIVPGGSDTDVPSN